MQKVQIQNFHLTFTENVFFRNSEVRRRANSHSSQGRSTRKIICKWKSIFLSWVSRTKLHNQLSISLTFLLISRNSSVKTFRRVFLTQLHLFLLTPTRFSPPDFGCRWSRLGKVSDAFGLRKRRTSRRLRDGHRRHDFRFDRDALQRSRKWVRAWSRSSGSSRSRFGTLNLSFLQLCSVWLFRNFWTIQIPT